MYTPFKKDLDTSKLGTYGALLSDIAVERPVPNIVTAPATPLPTAETALLQDARQISKLKQYAWVSHLAWCPAFIVGMVTYEYYKDYILPDINNSYASCDLNGIVDGYMLTKAFVPDQYGYHLSLVDTNATQFVIDKAKIAIPIWGSMGRGFGVLMGDAFFLTTTGAVLLYSTSSALKKQLTAMLYGNWGLIQSDDPTCGGMLTNTYRFATAFWPWAAALGATGLIQTYSLDKNGNTIHKGCWTDDGVTLGRDYATADYNNNKCPDYLPGAQCPVTDFYWLAIQAAVQATATMEKFDENRAATFFIAASTTGSIILVSQLLLYKIGNWINQRREVAEDRQSMATIKLDDPERALQIEQLEAEEEPVPNCFTRLRQRFGW